MKKVLLLFLPLIVLGSLDVRGQLHLSSGSFFVVSDDVFVSAPTVCSDGGIIRNHGQIGISGHIINNSGALTDASSNGVFIFNGTGRQQISGSSGSKIYGSVRLDNAAGLSLTDSVTGSNLEINGSLTMVHGIFSLGGFDLVLGSSSVSGFGTSNFIRTDGAGRLSRVVPSDGSTTVDFPVGNSAYNPVQLLSAANADEDTYLVGVKDSKPASFAGTDHLVNRSWQISEEVEGGSNLRVRLQWNATDETPDFIRSNCSIGTSTDDGATVSWGDLTATTGTDPYLLTLQGVASLGSFFVADVNHIGYSLDLVVFLGGAFDASTGLMKKTLQDSNLLPVNDPYGNGAVASAFPANTVDWIEVTLRDAPSASSATAATNLAGWPKSLLLRSDGHITDLDGEYYNLGNPQFTDSLFVVVRHRNHLDVLSSHAMSENFNYVYDFSTSVDKAYGGSAGYKLLSGGVYGMVSGDLDQNGVISISDYNQWAIGFGQTGLYSLRDANLDGSVSVTDYNTWAMHFGFSNPIAKSALSYRSMVP